LRRMAVWLVEHGVAIGRRQHRHLSCRTLMLRGRRESRTENG
jgi:hypothetical protein